MQTKFTLTLDERPIHVFSWINWQGPLDGKNLRFVVPLESKSTLEANRDTPFTLTDRDGEAWDLKITAIEPQYTGTNGVKVVGHISTRDRVEAPVAAPEPQEPEPEREEGLSEASESKLKLPTGLSIPMPKSLSEVSEVAADEDEPEGSEDSEDSED